MWRKDVFLHAHIHIYSWKKICWVNGLFFEIFLSEIVKVKFPFVIITFTLIRKWLNNCVKRIITGDKLVNV